MKQLALILVLLFLSFQIAATKKCFGPEFLWGAATAATQIEGAYLEDKQLSIWDVWSHLPNKTQRGDTPDIADDHYHKVSEDIALLKKMNMKNYRFSIAWTRIIKYEIRPSGEIVRSLNMPGIMHYMDEIKQLKEAGIEPLITLYHWDLPQFMVDHFNDWRSNRTINEFVYYADVCFKYFGPLGIKGWVPFNEPLSFVGGWAADGSAPPARTQHSEREQYEVGHNVILAHALVAKLYREKYAKTQGGIIGIINCGTWPEPRNPNSWSDKLASERAQAFNVGWFSDPFYFGDYPKEMRDTCGDRLPKFTEEQRQLLLKNKPDFYGFNHYTGAYVEMRAPSNESHGVYDDMHVNWFTTDLNGKVIGEQSESEWLYVVPWSIRRMLNWISNRYNRPPIYITENGCSAPKEDEKPLREALNDTFRLNYLKTYLAEIWNSKYIDGVDMKGYYVWSLMDNFEWNGGYRYRFGINYVDYKDPKLTRYQKASSIWYSNFVTTGCLDD